MSEDIDKLIAEVNSEIARVPKPSREDIILSLSRKISLALEKNPEWGPWESFFTQYPAYMESSSTSQERLALTEFFFLCREMLYQLREGQ